MERGKESPVLVVATMDTKGEEAMYLTSRLNHLGLKPRVMDAGIRGNPDWPVSFTRQEVAARGGTPLEEVQKIPHEGKALNAMIAGAVQIARELVEQGRIQGVIALGGSMGTTLGASVMRALPFGFPKVMVSTMASRNTRAFVGTRDILMLHSVCDLAGVNRMTRRVLENGAGALYGMVAGAGEETTAGERNPQVALSTLGTTEACAVCLRAALAEAGYEVVTFHTNGSGGQAMDEMVQEKEFDAVIDLSLHEMTDHVYGGDYDAGPERGAAALRQGIPAVWVPGNMDFIVTGPLAEAQRRFPGRTYHSHNEAITVVPASPGEMADLAGRMASRCREATGPLKVLVPSGGFSAFNDREGPLYAPESTASFIRALEKQMPERDLLEVVPVHINDNAFALEIMKAFFEVAGDVRRASIHT